jgi:HEXXH motif-containing protein
VSRKRFQTLSGDDLAALAWGGRTEPEVLARLQAGQLTKHKLLLRGVVRLGMRAIPDAAPALQECYEVLAAIERRAPECTATVIGNPHVGAWAARCLREISAATRPVRPDLDHLMAVTSAAAVRAGYPCTLTLRPVNGMVTLPTLGRARVPDGSEAILTVSGPMCATIATGAQVIVIGGHPEEDGTGWQHLRWLDFGSRRIPLEDLDPYRDYGRCQLAERLSRPEAERWRDALGQAWHLLSVHHPGYAATLQNGVTSLVPIVLKADDTNISATSGDAFAAVAASTPTDGAALALALVHEFQHAKLCAIADLEPLFGRKGEQLFYAPWRPDPRPAGALYHGVYAHMGVADFWRVQRRVVTGMPRLVAEVEFARWLGQTLDAATRLDGHRELTGAGQYLLSQIVARLHGWLDEPVPAQARELAKMTAADHLSCWRLRNLLPDRQAVTELAQSYLSGRPCRRTVHLDLCPPGDEPARNVRSDLLYQKLCDPDRFAAVAAGPGADPDIRFVRGDYPDALRGYLAQITADPAAEHAWSGLALISEPGGSLRQCPEVVCSVYRRLVPLSASPVDVLHLARWLAPVSKGSDTSQVLIDAGR